jgi:hypothetical protein
LQSYSYIRAIPLLVFLSICYSWYFPRHRYTEGFVSRTILLLCRKRGLVGRFRSWEAYPQRGLWDPSFFLSLFFLSGHEGNSRASSATCSPVPTPFPSTLSLIPLTGNLLFILITHHCHNNHQRSGFCTWVKTDNIWVFELGLSYSTWWFLVPFFRKRNFKCIIAETQINDHLWYIFLPFKITLQIEKSTLL